LTEQKQYTCKIRQMEYITPVFIIHTLNHYIFSFFKAKKEVEMKVLLIIHTFYATNNLKLTVSLCYGYFAMLKTDHLQPNKNYGKKLQ
jgi:hypothetical protein